MKDTLTAGYYEAFCEEAQNYIDEIDMLNIHAFTWTPDPMKYPSSDPRSQYKCLLNYILLVAFKYFKYFCFVPELNTNGNVHIHGWYIIKDNIAYYKSFIPKCKRLGFVLIKKKVNEKWFDYVNKEIDLTINVIGEDMPIPLTHCNCGSYKRLWRKKTGIKNTPHKYNVRSIMSYMNKK